MNWLPLMGNIFNSVDTSAVGTPDHRSSGLFIACSSVCTNAAPLGLGVYVRLRIYTNAAPLGLKIVGELPLILKILES